MFCLNVTSSRFVKLTAFGSYPHIEQYVMWTRTGYLQITRSQNRAAGLGGRRGFQSVRFYS